MRRGFPVLALPLPISDLVHLLMLPWVDFPNKINSGPCGHAVRACNYPCVCFPTKKSEIIFSRVCFVLRYLQVHRLRVKLQISWTCSTVRFYTGLRLGGNEYWSHPAQCWKLGPFFIFSSTLKEIRNYKLGSVKSLVATFMPIITYFCLIYFLEQWFFSEDTYIWWSELECLWIFKPGCVAGETGFSLDLECPCF